MIDKIRKTIAWLLVSCILGMVCPITIFSANGAVKAVMVTDFTDISNHWAAPALEAAIKNGLLKGVNGKINPKDPLKRAELAAILNRAFGANVMADIAGYKDVPHKWYYEDMAKAVQMGTLIGNGRKLNPENVVTRQEAFTSLARALKIETRDITSLEKFNDNKEISIWAKASLSALVDKAYITGNKNMIKPKDAITRAEFAQVMYNIIKQYITVAGTISEISTGNILVNVPGVTLKDVTIKGDLIVGDGVGTGDITLDNATITGRMVVRGGGIHSVKIKNKTKIGSSLIVDNKNGEVRIYTDDTVEIIKLDADKKVILDGNFTDVNIIGDGAVVSIKGNVKNIAATGKDVKILALEGAKIDKINMQAEGGSVSGDGAVAEVIVNGNNTIVSTGNTLVSVAKGVAGAIVGGQSMSEGNSGTTNSSGDSWVSKTPSQSTNPGNTTQPNPTATPSPIPSPNTTPTPNPWEFHVAVDGDDTKPGSLVAPFKTIKRAQEAVRAINRDMTNDITVYLHNGTYALNESLTFDEIDSGFNGKTITYKAYGDDKPIISGGKKITGWVLSDASKGIWKASAQGIETRQLYVNGKRAQRSVQKTLPEGLSMLQTTGDPVNEPHLATGFTTTDDVIHSWTNPSNIEFVYREAWMEKRCSIDSIDGNNIIMKQPGFRVVTFKDIMGLKIPGAGVREDARLFMENAYEFIDEAGEWCIDTVSNNFYYKPLPNEDMSSIEVVAPVLEKLIEGKGTLDKPVQNLNFEGLTFSHATWMYPTKVGFAEIQANVYLNENAVDPNAIYQYTDTLWEKSEANISFSTGKNINFTGNVFTQLGTAALEFENGSQENNITGNTFTDISGTAIQIGGNKKVDHHPEDPRNIVGNIIINNNYIHDVSSEYIGGTAIWVGYCENIEISHNTIHDLPYTAISVGWGWGGADVGYMIPAITKNYLIKNNHIFDLMKQQIDGGGIYTLGSIPGTLITENVMHGQKADFGTLYYDDYTNEVTGTRNILYDNKRNIITKGTKNKLIGNYWDSDDWNMYAHDEKSEMRDNVSVPDGNFPLEIINKTGLEKQWLKLLPKEKTINRAFGKVTRTFVGTTYLNSKTDENRSKNIVDNDLTTNTKLLEVNSGVMVDLGLELDVKAVAVNFEKEYIPEEFVIEATIDGINWTTIKIVQRAEVNDSGRYEASFTQNIAMRDIRVKATNGSMVLTEIEVYEKAGDLPNFSGSYSDFELYIPNTKVSIGTTSKVSIKGIYSNGLKAIAKEVIANYSSNAADRVSINTSTGDVTSHSAGAATITATFSYGGKDQTKTIVVTGFVDEIGSLQFKSTMNYFRVGDIIDYTLDGLMLSGSDVDFSRATVSYTSSNPEVATVSGTTTKPVITPVSKGKTIIEATVILDGKTVKYQQGVIVTEGEWNVTNIGPSQGEAYQTGDGKWHVTNKGDNIYTAMDDFTYVYKTVNKADYPDGVSIQMTIDSIENLTTNDMVGLMIRQRLDRMSRNVNYRMHSRDALGNTPIDGKNRMPYTYRLGDGTQTSHYETDSIPYGTKIMLTLSNGKAFAHYYDATNSGWVLAGTVKNFNIEGDFTVGVARCSNDTTLFSSSVVDGLRVLNTNEVEGLQLPHDPIEISIGSTVLQIGNTTTLSALLLEPGETVSFESSAPAIATIDANGVITSLSEGIATMTVKALRNGVERENGTKTVTITVCEALSDLVTFNAALSKPSTAYTNDFTSQLSSHLTIPFKNGNDGNMDSYTQASGSYDYTYVVNLGSLQTLQKMRVYFAANVYATSFEFLASNDGITWRTIDSKTDTKDSIWYEYTFESPQAAKYVAVRALAPNGPDQPGAQMAIVEFEAIAYKSPIKEAINLAWGKDAYAYAPYSHNEEPVVDNAGAAVSAAGGVDGNDDTYIAPAVNYNWWYKVDLGSEQGIKELNVLFDETYFATEYVMMASNDDTIWNDWTAWDISTEEAKEQTFARYGVIAYRKQAAGEQFNIGLQVNPVNVNARYVAIFAIKPDGDGQDGLWMVIKEFQAMDMARTVENITENVAVGKPVKAYKTNMTEELAEHASLPLNLCVDGSLSTFSYPAATQETLYSFVVDLEKTCKIAELKLYMPVNGWASSFEYLTSLDGINWDVIYTETSATDSQWLIYNLPTIKEARYVAVRSLAQVNYCMCINELEVIAIVE